MSPIEPIGPVRSEVPAVTPVHREGEDERREQREQQRRRRQAQAPPPPPAEPAGEQVDVCA